MVLVVCFEAGNRCNCSIFITEEITKDVYIKFCLYLVLCGTNGYANIGKNAAVLTVTCL